ncbi:hypothetical protein HDV00_010806 [Rhizophlyctis rosea]|nr:hypothetical protein HDV00_010806 [Rhizophlyctis rosea]
MWRVTNCICARTDEYEDGLLWEDRVNTIWSVSCDFSAQVSKSRAVLSDRFAASDTRAVLADGGHFLALIDATLKVVSEMGSRDEVEKLPADVVEAQLCLSQFSKDFQEYIRHAENVDPEKVKSLLTSLTATAGSFQTLTKSILAWLMRQDIHHKEIDLFMLKLQLVSRSRLLWLPDSAIHPSDPTNDAIYIQTNQPNRRVSTLSFRTDEDGDPEDPSRATPDELRRIVSSWSLKDGRGSALLWEDEGREGEVFGGVKDPTFNDDIPPSVLCDSDGDSAVELMPTVTSIIAERRHHRESVVYQPDVVV